MLSMQFVKTLLLCRLDANRSQMLGTVSHELRNNLSGVLGLTDVVANLEDLEPAEAQELVTMANQQALDAIEIVEDLLTASRLEQAVLNAETSPVDVNPLWGPHGSWHIRVAVLYVADAVRLLRR